MPSGEKSTPGGNAGWGGPPKGAGRGGPARHPKKEFKKSGEPNVGVALVPDFDGTQPGPGRGHFSVAGEERAERQRRHDEEMSEIQYDLAHNAPRPETRLAAAVGYQNRLVGTPVARNLNTNVDDIAELSDEQLAERLARLDRIAAEIEGRSASPPLPERPDGMVR